MGRDKLFQPLQNGQRSLFAELELMHECLLTQMDLCVLGSFTEVNGKNIVLFQSRYKSRKTKLKNGFHLERERPNPYICA